MNKNSSNKVIETELAILYWIDEEDGIVCGKTKARVEVTIALLKKDFETYEKYFQHPHRKLLLDISDMMGANKEIRDFFASSEGVYKYFDAVAVFVQSRLSVAGILGYVAIKVYPLLKPTQMFYDKDVAIKWLRSL
jgi:hypothetical protein